MLKLFRTFFDLMALTAMLAAVAYLLLGGILSIYYLFTESWEFLGNWFLWMALGAVGSTLLTFVSIALIRDKETAAATSWITIEFLFVFIPLAIFNAFIAGFIKFFIWI